MIGTPGADADGQLPLYQETKRRLTQNLAAGDGSHANVFTLHRGRLILHEKICD